jgi:hypothetical protein
MKKIFLSCLTLTFLISLSFFGCNKEQKQDQTQINPPAEQFVDKEKELKEREEVLKIREENLNAREQIIIKKEQELGLKADTTKTETKTTDTIATTTTQKDDKKKKNDKKEKELNKKTDNPQETISEYIEDLKRAITNPDKYNDNMKKANDLWAKDRLGVLKSSYKNTKKISVVTAPSVISNKNNKATIKVKIKKTDNVNNQEKESTINVTYYLSADSNGKWKINSNVIDK